MKRMMLAATLLAILLAGCTNALRFGPSEAVQENAALSAAASERLAALTATQDTVTPAMQKLARAAADGFRAAIVYVGLPDDTAFLDTVRQLESENVDEQAAAAAAASATATQAATEGAARPTPEDVIDSGNLWVDLGLDTARTWAELLGAVGVGLWIKKLREGKDVWVGALKTTVKNIEEVADRMPPEFYALQTAALQNTPEAAVIDEAGGTGPVKATP